MQKRENTISDSSIASVFFFPGALRGMGFPARGSPPAASMVQKSNFYGYSTASQFRLRDPSFPSARQLRWRWFSATNMP